MGKARDLTGHQYSYLMVLKREGSNRHGKPTWRCRCVCGREIVVPGYYLNRKGRKYHQRSCGCMKNKLISQAQTKHGMSHHPAFAVWHSMKQRCEDPQHRAYQNYGGRGIKVCEEWQRSFETFWHDMGSTYKQGLELDRIDNDKGYCAENCRWVERKINARNRRVTRLIDTPYGRMSVAELCELTGIGETTILYRLDHKWPTEFLCAKPDYRNVYTTSGIVVRGTDSQCGQMDMHE